MFNQSTINTVSHIILAYDLNYNQEENFFGCYETAMFFMAWEATH